MNEKSTPSNPQWVDPDEAPELNAEWFAAAAYTVDGQGATPAQGRAALRAQTVRGRPVGSTKADAKQAVTVRYSPDVLAAFKATGTGWQARMNDALRDWLRTHEVAG